MFTSVIICTKNPRQSYLKRAISSIQRQSLKKDLEFIVVDNGSATPVKDLFYKRGDNIKWVVQQSGGLTQARISGFSASKGSLIIYVDDDNLLDKWYLENALKLSKESKQIGVWSAEITAKFEKKPPQWAEKYFPFLALISHPQERTSNRPNGGTLPIGAGMVVRRAVMAAYAKELLKCSVRSRLDRHTGSLMAAGDTDIGYTALKLGYACCYTKKLKVQHLISKQRLNPNYLHKLAREVSASHELLRCIHENKEFSFKEKLKVAVAKLISPFASKKSKYGFKAAVQIGKWEGHNMYHKIYKSMRNKPRAKTSLMNKRKNHDGEPK
jgi:glycosyltransferase involved in cell wall biosynthesis